MTSCTDKYNLNEKRLFKDVKASLACGAAGVKETRNVLEIRENVLYVCHQNADECRVLTFNVAAVRDKPDEDVPYQVIQLFTIISHYVHARALSRDSFDRTCARGNGADLHIVQPNLTVTMPARQLLTRAPFFARCLRMIDNCVSFNVYVQPLCTFRLLQNKRYKNKTNSFILYSDRYIC